MIKDELVKALVDTWAQLSTVSEEFSLDHGRTVKPHEWLGKLEEKDGFEIPYK